MNTPNKKEEKCDGECQFQCPYGFVPHEGCPLHDKMTEDERKAYSQSPTETSWKGEFYDKFVISPDDVDNEKYYRWNIDEFNEHANPFSIQDFISDVIKSVEGKARNSLIKVGLCYGVDILADTQDKELGDKIVRWFEYLDSRHKKLMEMEREKEIKSILDNK